MRKFGGEKTDKETKKYIDDKIRQILAASQKSFSSLRRDMSDVQKRLKKLKEQD